MLTCYSAGPGLFPKVLPDGRVETWDEAQIRVRKLNSLISNVPYFSVITPSNDNLVDLDVSIRAQYCMLEDMLYAYRSDIVFADITPFGGREPDCGTVVEATTCALSGGLLVLWMDPLTTFDERYHDANVRPNDPALGLNDHCNLMLEQLFKRSWQTHFGFSVPVFNGLQAAVDKTAEVIGPDQSIFRIPLMEDLHLVKDQGIFDAVRILLTRHSQD